MVIRQFQRSHIQSADEPFSLDQTQFMAQGREMLGNPLPSVDALDYFMTSSEAETWAAEFQVSPTVLRYHLADLGWVTHDTALVV
ncbi:MAG: hypothetical protein M1415_11270 [Firmicutes bacterium]|nr:hypothetical protein [Bacillota bacterium]